MPLGKSERIWVISAIHSDVEKLIKLHDALLEQFTPNDRILYTGNYTGYSNYPIQTIDELLTFRRLVLSVPCVKASDIVYLRGQQEEMMDKLLQLQFAPNPEHVLLWLLSHGIAPTIQAYGIDANEGVIAAREGVLGLARWTNKIRNALKVNEGHDIFLTNQKRAAYTDNNLLFVHAGLDPERPLEQQGDSFWWADNSFENIKNQYANFSKIFRGFDPNHNGININCVTATLDGGCGFGGKLTCAGIDINGDIFELFEI